MCQYDRPLTMNLFCNTSPFSCPRLCLCVTQLHLPRRGVRLAVMCYCCSFFSSLLFWWFHISCKHFHLFPCFSVRAWIKPSEERWNRSRRFCRPETGLLHSHRRHQHLRDPQRYLHKISQLSQNRTYSIILIYIVPNVRHELLSFCC